MKITFHREFLLLLSFGKVRAVTIHSVGKMLSTIVYSLGKMYFCRGIKMIDYVEKKN
jgi:hypothetical protein